MGYLKAHKPSPAMVVALISLFVGLSGGAYATVALNQVRSVHIKNGEVKRADLANNAVNSAKVANGSLALADLSVATQAALKGNTGPQGPAGPAGPTGPAGAVSGVAGGALTGTYPNPLIAADAVGSTEVIADSLTSADISETGLVISGDVTGTLGSAQLGANVVGSGEVAANSLRLADLAIGVRSGSTLDLFNPNIAPGACSTPVNDGIASGDAPIGSFTFVTEVRLASGAENPGWTVEGRTTTTVDAARVVVCNNTGVAAVDAPNLYFSYITIAP